MLELGPSCSASYTSGVCTSLPPFVQNTLYSSYELCLKLVDRTYAGTHLASHMYWLLRAMQVNEALSWSVLQTSRRQIRLLKVWQEEPWLELELAVYELDTERCRFTVLSYIWGTEAACHVIIINGQRFLVRESVRHCLNVGAKSDKEYFIDAVRVEQSNVFEKNHQAGFREQIYESAWHVESWLHTCSVDLANEFDQKDVSHAVKSIQDKHYPGFYIFTLPPVFTPLVYQVGSVDIRVRRRSVAMQAALLGATLDSAKKQSNTSWLQLGVTSLR